jgi:hypothetical protein
MSVDRILLVHGYSETSLDTYSDFPKILTEAGYMVDQIALSAFNSLDDTITIDDLAVGLEEHAQDLEARGWNFATAAVICHSTGALVARRWMLNRRQASATASVPSHLITMAGANHGSTLAQIGKSPLGYLQKLLQKKEVGVGAGVLTDLDYGRDFLLRLNRDWLTAANNGHFNDLYIFSMGGDSLGNDKAVEFLWQSSEPGSDNTVRISGANLNYRFLFGDPGAGVLTELVPSHPVPARHRSRKIPLRDRHRHSGEHTRHERSRFRRGDDRAQSRFPRHRPAELECGSCRVDRRYHERQRREFYARHLPLRSCRAPRQRLRHRVSR